MPTEIRGIKFYLIPEVAKELKVSQNTVRSYIKQGKINGQRIGRPIMVTEESIQDFLENIK